MTDKTVFIKTARGLDPLLNARSVFGDQKPLVVIAGAPRCGTTDLFARIADLASCAPCSDKEPGFWHEPDYPVHGHKPRFSTGGSVDQYAQQFTDAESSAFRLEATVDYFYSAHAARTLGALEAACIVSLRPPEQRVLSVFRFAKNVLGTVDPNVGFGAAVRMLLSGESGWTSSGALQRSVEESAYERYFEHWAGQTNLLVRPHSEPLDRVWTFLNGLGIETSQRSPFAGQGNSSARVTTRLERLLIRANRSIGAKAKITKPARRVLQPLLRREEPSIDLTEEDGLRLLAGEFASTNAWVAANLEGFERWRT